MGSVLYRELGHRRSTNVMCPSAWVTAGPSATRRTVHSRAQRTASVFAPASVATISSPGCRFARDSPVPARISRPSEPLVGEPGAPISARYAAPRRPSLGGTKPTDSAPDVPAGRKARLGHEAHATAGSKGVDPARHLVGSDELASEAAEGTGRHGDPALDVRSTGCNDPGTAAAIERVERRRARCERRDEDAIAEETDGVNRDPGREGPRGKIRKPAAPAAPIDADDPGSRVRIEREDHVPPEGAARA